MPSDIPAFKRWLREAGPMKTYMTRRIADRFEQAESVLGCDLDDELSRGVDVEAILGRLADKGGDSCPLGVMRTAIGYYQRFMASRQG